MCKFVMGKFDAFVSGSEKQIKSPKNVFKIVNWIFFFFKLKFLGMDFQGFSYLNFKS